MKIFLLALALLFSSLIFLSCKKDNPVSPEDNIAPGRRDYTWTIDTLFLPFNFFTDITGTSPTDVWVCSPGDADKIFYHFDGQSWKTDSIARPFSPKSISSFSKNDVWSSGRTGMIWRFNGSQWSQELRYSLNGNNDITFENICAINSNKVLAAGQYFINQNFWGILLRYDGTSWIEINIPQIRTAFIRIEISGNGIINLWGVTDEQFTESRYQFYELDGDSLKEIYSGSQSTNADYGSIFQLGNKNYFIIGYDFYSYNGFNFSKIGKLSDDPKFLNVGWGRNEKDIFLGMRDGIAHYNGENTIYLYQASGNIFVRKGIVFDKEVFFIGRDANGNNLMIHGKLK